MAHDKLVVDRVWVFQLGLTRGLELTMVFCEIGFVKELTFPVPGCQWFEKG